MSIKMSKSASNNLFIAVDTDYSGNVVFTFHKDYENEAINIIPVLPIYLEFNYGPRAWGWFNADAKEDLSGYYYDKNTGEILSNESGYTDQILTEDMWQTEDDHTSSKGKIFEFSLSEWFINDKPNTTNVYNDNGTVKSGMSKQDDTSTATEETTPSTTEGKATSMDGLSSLTQDSSVRLGEALHGLTSNQIEILIKSITLEKENPKGMFSDTHHEHTTQE